MVMQMLVLISQGKHLQTDPPLLARKVLQDALSDTPSRTPDAFAAQEAWNE